MWRIGLYFFHMLSMSGVIFESTMRKFASKVRCESHDPCLCFIIFWSCENLVSQIYYDDTKGINTSKVALEIKGYSFCCLKQNSANSVS